MLEKDRTLFDELPEQYQSPHLRQRLEQAMAKASDPDLVDKLRIRAIMHAQEGIAQAMTIGNKFDLDRKLYMNPDGSVKEWVHEDKHIQETIESALRAKHFCQTFRNDDRSFESARKGAKAQLDRIKMLRSPNLPSLDDVMSQLTSSQSSTYGRDSANMSIGSSDNTRPRVPVEAVKFANPFSPPDNLSANDEYQNEMNLDRDSEPYLTPRRNPHLA